MQMLVLANEMFDSPPVFAWVLPVFVRLKPQMRGGLSCRPFPEVFFSLPTPFLALPLYPDRTNQQGKVPVDDLPDNTEWLLKVVCRGCLVELRERPFLRTEDAREIAEVVAREGEVRVDSLADGLAVVAGLDP